MKRVKKGKGQGTPLGILLLAVGFGAGYATKELSEPPQKAIQQPRLASSSTDSPIFVCFTPNKHCQTKILEEIGTAKTSIYVQAYSFTDKDIAQSLASAARRGVSVNILLDKSNRNDQRSAKDIALQANIPLRFDAPPGIAHNKVMIIDETKVISGSYNFSAAAYKRNTENLLVIHSPSLAQAYLQNWQARWRVSE